VANAGVSGRPIVPSVLSAQERACLERQVRHHRVLPVAIWAMSRDPAVTWYRWPLHLHRRAFVLSIDEKNRFRHASSRSCR